MFLILAGRNLGAAVKSAVPKKEHASLSRTSSAKPSNPLQTSRDS
jgi:hypothetical protein